MDVLEAMQRDAGVELTELKVDGGASVNDQLMQFQSDILGATALGMRYQLTLAEEPARLEQFPRINRLPLRAASTIAAFENALRFERGRST